jgi:hypothetical protein
MKGGAVPLTLCCAAALVLSSFMLMGCASAPLQGLNSALFPRGGPAAAGVAGRVALLVPPQVSSSLGRHEDMLGSGPNRQVVIGRIVERAGLDALGESLSGGVKSVVEVPAVGAGFDTTVVIDEVRCVDRTRLLWLLPVPIPFVGVIGDSSTEVQVAFDLRVLDAQGRTVLTRTYGTAPVVWERPSSTRESRDAGVIRIVHEGSWRLWQEAVADLRAWLAEQRIKPRDI